MGYHLFTGMGGGGLWLDSRFLLHALGCTCDGSICNVAEDMQ